MSNFGEQLVSLRKSRQLTQRKLAELSKLSQQSLSLYEKGFKNPNIETVEKLASALRVHISSFFPSEKQITLSLEEESVIIDLRSLDEEHRRFILKAVNMAKSSFLYREAKEPVSPVE